MREKNKVNKVQQNLSKCCTSRADSPEKTKYQAENKDKDKENSLIKA